MAGGISITGMGIICAIGHDAAQVSESLRRGKSGIGRMRHLDTAHSELPVGELELSNAQMKAMLGQDENAIISRTALMGAIAIRQALAQAGTSSLAHRRVALISGTTVGDMDLTEHFFERMKSDDSLLSLPQSNECGQSSLRMASLCGLEDAEVCTISTACSSALNAIIIGCEMLKRDEADIVIAGGSEALTRFHLNGFNSLMILDKEPCRPFDSSCAGLNLGEGAAFVVLEKNAAKPLAYIAGYGNKCDAFHQTASSPDGDGAFLAMSEALELAGLKAEEIDYVNAHGTGTPSNDNSESAALKRVFGSNMPLVSSTKAFTGHTTSASGSIETVICLLAMQEGFVPANLGWSAPLENGIRPVTALLERRLEHVICNSFGFGGNDSSLILSRKPLDSGSAPGTDYGFETAADVLVDSAEDLSSLKEFIPMMELRRMGKLLKASHLSSLRALAAAGLESPDAIITATASGMLATSQLFLDDIVANGEQLLKPTLFMQSTHNTIGSAIAIRCRCHGYNVTYSQGAQSLEWAIRDAERQIATGKARTVLVGLYDECTELSASFARRAGLPCSPEVYARTLILKRKQ
ncbi:MAG: beta-ketoacyl synthase chain length factor [Bacteroidales bacterium]|nr:beta-ketoacyl synthase chain length factor [Bacteroidales bacterium]